MPGSRPLLVATKGVNLARPIDDSIGLEHTDALTNLGAATSSGSQGSQAFELPSEPHQLQSWLPSRSTFVFLLVALHLAALCYWCYLMYLSHRRAKAAAAARGEPRTPPPKVNCTYDWSSLGEKDPESKSFFSRFRFKPFLERKSSGKPIERSELATVGIIPSGPSAPSGLPSRPRITRTPTLPSTPELV